MTVAGLLLAAGGGCRWGEGSKLLAPFGEGTVVEAAARGLADSGARPLVAVVDPDRPRAARRLEACGFRTVPNPGAERGQAGSLALGIRTVRLRSEAPAALVVLGDEPSVRPEAFRALLRAWGQEAAGETEASSARILRVRYRDRPGHPVLLPRALFGAMEALDGDRGAASWMERHPGRVREVPVAFEAPVDVDRPADLREAERRRRAEPPGSPTASR